MTEKEYDEFDKLCLKVNALFNTHLLSENNQARVMFEQYVSDFKNRQDLVESILGEIDRLPRYSHGYQLEVGWDDIEKLKQLIRDKYGK